MGADHILPFRTPEPPSKSMAAVIGGRRLVVTVAVAAPDDPMLVHPVRPGGMPFTVMLTDMQTGEQAYATPHCPASASLYSPPLLTGGC